MDLYEFDDTKACNLALSKAVKDFIIKEKLHFLALSGGKSPLGFFHCLKEEELEWQNINICLVDERIISTHHNESNTHFIHKEFLQNKAAKAHFIPMIDDEKLKDLNALKAFANKQYKQAELAILGMGTDGHTASLFADADEFDEALKTEDNIILLSPKKAAYQRLSMSLKALENCKKLFLLIQGAEKKAVFDKACEKVDTNLPISFILHSKKVLCDVYYSK